MARNIVAKYLNKNKDSKQRYLYKTEAMLSPFSMIGGKTDSQKKSFRIENEYCQYLASTDMLLLG